MYLEGNAKEEALVAVDPSGRPSWLSPNLYLILTMLCLGWTLRIYLYRSTVNIDYYLKKVILK